MPWVSVDVPEAHTVKPCVLERVLWGFGMGSAYHNGNLFGCLFVFLSSVISWYSFCCVVIISPSVPPVNLIYVYCPYKSLYLRLSHTCWIHFALSLKRKLQYFFTVQTLCKVAGNKEQRLHMEGKRFVWALKLGLILKLNARPSLGLLGTSLWVLPGTNYPQT